LDEFPIFLVGEGFEKIVAVGSGKKRIV